MRIDCFFGQCFSAAKCLEIAKCHAYRIGMEPQDSVNNQ